MIWKRNCDVSDVTREALINCDWKLNVWISGFGCFVWTMFLPSVTSKEETLHISKAKQKNNRNVNFALLSKGETSEQLIHVPLHWQNLHKTLKSQSTFASGEHIMADPVRTLEKHTSCIWETWSSCILVAVGLSLMPSAWNCCPAFSVKFSYWWLLAFQGVHSFEMRLLVLWSSACYYKWCLRLCSW